MTDRAARVSLQRYEHPTGVNPERDRSVDRESHHHLGPAREHDAALRIELRPLEQPGHDADAAPPALAGGVDRDRELEVVALAPGVELARGRAAARERGRRRARSRARAARGPRAPRRSPAAAARGRARRRRRRRRVPAARGRGQARPNGPLTPSRSPAPAAHAAAGSGAHGADRVRRECLGASRIAADRDRHLTDPERVQHRELAGFEAPAFAALGAALLKRLGYSVDLVSGRRRGGAGGARLRTPTSSSWMWRCRWMATRRRGGFGRGGRRMNGRARASWR